MSTIYLIPKDGEQLRLDRVQAVDSDELKNKRTVCPFHKGDSTTVFSVDIDKGGFICFKPSCGIKGIAVDPAEYYRLKEQDQNYRQSKQKEQSIELWDDVSFSELEESKPKKSALDPDFSKIIREHIYTDEQGAPVHRTIYYATKDGKGKMPFQHHFENGKWIANLNGINRLPYNLPNILHYDTLIYVEGEKDVDTFLSLGIKNATTLGSANSELKEHQEQYFKDKTVMIIPDQDEPGHICADYLSRALDGIAKEIFICSLPHLDEGSGQDFSDWIEKLPPEIRKGINQTNIVNGLLKVSTKYEPDISFIDFVKQYKDYPLGIFSSDIQTYIKEVSEVMSAPSDWIGGAIMAVSSSLLGNKTTLDCGFGDWIARPYFSFITVCQSGSNKTHPIKKVMAYMFEQDDSQNKIYQTQKKNYENSLHKAKTNKSEYLPDKPKRKRYFINDSTLEQVSKALNDNPQGVLWYMNEIAALFNGLGQYKQKNNDNERFIDLLDGVPISVMRGDIDLSVSNPYINILGTTQPQIIREIIDQYKDNGLAYRFCFCYLPKQEYVVKDNTTITTRAYLQTFFSYLNAIQSGYAFTFDLDAKQLAKTIINVEFNKIDKYSKRDPVISGIVSKIRTQFINFCLLIHCMKYHKDISAKMEIDSNTVKQAFRLALYYLYHNYITLYSDNAFSSEFKKIKQYCSKKKIDTIKVRDIQKNVLQEMKSEDIRALLLELEKRGKGAMIDDTTYKVLA